MVMDQLRRLAEEEERLRAQASELADRGVPRSRQIAEIRARLALEPARRAEAEVLEAARARAEAARLAQVDAVARLSERAEEAVRRQRRAEAAAAERDRLNRDAETVESKAEWLATGFHDAVLTMEKRVLEQAQADFAETFRVYFAALMDDVDLVAVVDAAFTPSVEIRGRETPAEALSGGERTSLALAYRLALSRVVRALGHLRLDTLLLDEPTDGFSPEQVQSMGELLARLDLPQVILVSHERELESIADRVVVVEKTDGASALRESSRPDAASADGSVPAT
ncbi:SMC domain protein [mine drainage metagenome]|uniref:SMC domain protein n=1 Tax=mine drainage metagenome TaxID=410659 RepID=T1CUV0_9ZZZZ